MKKATVSVILLVVITLLAACDRQISPTSEHGENGNEVHDAAAQIEMPGVVDEAINQPRTDAERDKNLEKLGKVWGFVKYTHHSFITGQKCWDEELLQLIPIIYNANTEDVNGILYDWFIGLYDGYDTAIQFILGSAD